MKNNFNRRNLIMKSLSTLILCFYFFSFGNIKVKAEDTIEVINNSFTNNLDGWTIDGSQDAVMWKENGKNGTGALNYWSDKPYVADTHQTITGLENGTYKIEAYAMNTGTNNSLYMYAKGSDGTEKKADIEKLPDAFSKINLEIKVTTGSQVTIGFYSDAQGGAWAGFDNVSITKGQDSTEDTKGNIINPQFKENLDGWTIEDPQKVSSWAKWGDGTIDSGSLEYGSYQIKDGNYEVNTYQTITGLENGTYMVEAHAATAGGQDQLYMYAKDFDLNDSQEEVKESILRSDNFRLSMLEVNVTNNQMTIGFYSKGGPNKWVCIDNVSITLKHPDNRIALDKISNYSFADGSEDWRIIGDNNAVSIDNKGCDDDKSLRYSFDKDYEVKAEQIIKGIENGNYRLEMYATSSGGQDRIYAYAKDFGKGEARTSIPIDENFRKIVVNFKVTNNKATIGFYSKAPKDTWSNFDNVKLFKVNEGYEFLKGGDLTAVNQIEDSGGVYYDQKGNPRDVFHILAENGFNLTRLRIYNQTGRDNFHTNDDGKEYYLPAGYQDKEDVLKLAKRAKDVGMKIEISLHYSDFWSNGGIQDIPLEWKKQIEGLDNDAAVNKLEELVYAYTKDIMQSLKEQGTTPQYISFGNEMQEGILFPYGKIDEPEQFGKFINAGYRAVKEVNEDTQVILHLDEAGDNTRYYKMFDNCEKYNINYDIIGSSYYPFWTQNTVEQIIPWYNNLYDKYHKKIMIMETGYNWNETLPSGDPGQLSDNGTENHPSTPQGQKEFMDEVFNGIRNAKDNCIIGDLYWDPVMIYNKNVGWAVEKGKAEDGSQDIVGDSIVSNTTLFDFNGKALKALLSYADNTEGTTLEMISGQAVDSNGKIISDAIVTLEINGQKYTRTTDKYGRFFINQLKESESAKLTVKKDGYENVVKDVNITEGKVLNVVVTLSQKGNTGKSNRSTSKNNNEDTSKENEISTKGGFKKNIDGTLSYYDKYGNKLKDTWVEESGKWYLLGSNEAVVKGWAKVKEIWYYLNEDGSMKTGWLNENGVWYYLNGNGSMKAGWLNENGVWYYLNGNGSMATDRLNENGTWYYFNNDGSMR